ncbi:uncharacterized protein FTOL_10854 [Fusarium torulosum]|uniref:Uncharacterized protein n=1 Tax=Fusarium torulosum TaxID=33205 RepID=A0AAE8MIX9_9HYPO|nr:uncharacterized protein FTOL_10854 [Fusarium torulosum]
MLEAEHYRPNLFFAAHHSSGSEFHCFKDEGGTSGVGTDSRGAYSVIGSACKIQHTLFQNPSLPRARTDGGGLEALVAKGPRLGRSCKSCTGRLVVNLGFMMGYSVQHLQALPMRGLFVTGTL